MQQDDSQQAAELRLAFLRHLPKRLEMLRKRGLRQCTQGWDINALTNLLRETQVLSGACGRYGLLDMGKHLYSLENFLAPFVEQVAIPNASQSSAFAGELGALGPLIAEHERQYGEAAVRAAPPAPVVEAAISRFPLLVTPPADYYKRFLRDVAPTSATPSATIIPTPAAPVATPTISAPRIVTPAPTVTAPVNAVTPSPPAIVRRLEPQPAPTTVAAPRPAAPAAPAESPRSSAPPVIIAPSRPATTATASVAATPASPPERIADGGVRKIYHLSDGSPLAFEIDRKLELGGHELTVLEKLSELEEMLASFPPHMVIVDAEHQGALAAIGERIKAARGRTNHRLTMLSLSHSADLPVRLQAMRAGADAFIALPVQIDDVMTRIAELLAADSADPFRVLIVEDDRSQAIFAESILRKAGMNTCMVTDPLAALDQLDQFKPELILMDLYMPNCDGMELTAIIREREAFISTPIVFLSGENDQEKHFEALNSGGDDFLSKPIRPKHLISAVTNRARRARQLGRRALAQNPRDPVTGLYERAFVIDRVNALLAQEEAPAQGGGLLYIDIDAAGQIRERVGLTVFDALLNQIGAFLTAHVDGRDLTTRYGDTSFALLHAAGDETALKQLAVDLRERTTREVFQSEGKTFTLGLSIGICLFSAALGDVGAMLNAAERAMTESRLPGAGHVGVFHPQAKNARVTAQDALGNHIRAALKSDDFQLLFQPIVALQGDSGEQFQALLRLRGDGGKLYTAAEIVPVAEREALIDEVDRWVLSRCLMVLAERARLRRPVRLFVNQSITATHDAQRIAWLKQALETRRLAGDQLVLEFRLGDALAQTRELTDFGARARELGIGISIAAFEASATAFQLLEHVPVSFIKIASRYIDEGLRNPATRAELQQIVAYAHGHEQHVIAPRIEDAQSAAALWTAGIDYIQGDFVQQAGKDMSFDFHAAAH